MVYRPMKTPPLFVLIFAGDRRAIVEILRDTKKDLPAYFQ